MVFNVQVPAGLTNYSVVFYFVSKELTPGSLLQRFVNGDDEFRNSRMKLIPSVPKKRPLDLNDGSGVSARLINTSKIKNSSSNESAVENEETISDNDLDNIVIVANGSELEEMEYPSALLCDLRPYQKHALFFMVRLEKGPCVDDAATTLHPCWDAYHLADKWCHDIGCEQAANKPLLKTVFQVMLRLFSLKLCCGVKQG